MASVPGPERPQEPPGESRGTPRVPPRRQFAQARRWAIANDATDFGLYLFGLLTLMLGDAVECLVGGFLDIWVFSRLLLLTRLSHHHPRARRYLVGILVLEFLDVTDLFMLGVVDLLGWIELLPWWWIFTWHLEDEFAPGEQGGPRRRQVMDGGLDEGEDLDALETRRDENEAEQRGAQGGRREQGAGAVSEPHITCPACGRELPAGTRLCEWCGTDLSHVTPT